MLFLKMTLLMRPLIVKYFQTGNFTTFVAEWITFPFKNVNPLSTNSFLTPHYCSCALEETFSCLTVCRKLGKRYASSSAIALKQTLLIARQYKQQFSKCKLRLHLIHFTSADLLIGFLFPISSSYSTSTPRMYKSNHAKNFSNKSD